MTAQGGALVFGAETAAFLQQRHDLVDEFVEAAGGEVRNQDEAVARVGLHIAVDLGGDVIGGADELLPRGDLDDQFADAELLGLGLLPPGQRDGARILGVADAAARDVQVVLRFDVRQRPFGVVPGQVAAPHLLEERDRGLRAHLLQPDVAGSLGRVLRGVAEDERRGRKDLQVGVAAPVLREAALDVGVEGVALLEGAVAGEDGVGLGGAEFAALVRVAGLQEHRVSLRAAWHLEPPGDVELRGVDVERSDVGIRREDAVFAVDDRCSGAPAVPQPPGDVDDLVGADVALRVVEIAATPEVLAGEGVGGGDEVPRGAAVGQMVEGGELLGQFVRLVEGGVDRAREPEVGRRTGEGLENRKGVGPADDVEIVDAAAVFAQPQSLGQEEEVEQSAFCGPGQVQEGLEVDLALRFGIRPHGRVVDAREVRGQMDLLSNGVLRHGCRPPQAVA
ncbi:hypothetical protein AIIKEEIJ_00120 [Rhodococcus sp. YH1]|nr:hypothetical protein [Rhodococcus sp. YH1]